MEQLLSDKIKSILGTLATEVDDVNKEYAMEKIDTESKREQIESSINIAKIRAFSAIKGAIGQINTDLKKERVPQSVIEKVKELFYAQM